MTMSSHTFRCRGCGQVKDEPSQQESSMLRAGSVQAEGYCDECMGAGGKRVAKSAEQAAAVAAAATAAAEHADEATADD